MILNSYHILLDIVLITSTLYLICIVAFTIGLYKLREVLFTFNKSNSVKVSVLVAARNEEKNIEKLLQSLYNQSFSKELFEVIMIDDHSDDNTKNIIEDFIIKYKDINLKVFNADNIGKKAAISQALHLAHNELILVTDADCFLEPTWIESFVNFYQYQGCKMILAPVLLSPAETFFEKIQVLEHLSLIGSTAGSAAIGFPVMCNGANMAYEREAALEVEKYRKDFNIPSGDDMFLMEQFVRNYGHENVKFLLSKNAIVKTKTCKNIKEFFRQRRRWVSKTKSYTSWKIIATALVVFFFNLSIVSLLIGAFFNPSLWSYYFSFTLLKFLTDYPLLKKITTFMNQKGLLKWSFLLEFIYPFYVVFTAISGMLINVKWKR